MATKKKSKKKPRIPKEEIVIHNGIEMYRTPFGLMCVNPDDFYIAIARAAENKEGFYGQSF